MTPWLYAQDSCLAQVPPEGLRAICPGDDAVLVMELAILAFVLVVAWYVVEGIAKDWREHKRRQRFEELYGHRQEGNADGLQGVGPPPTPWL